MASLLQIRCPMFLSALCGSRNEIYFFGGPYLLYLDFFYFPYPGDSLAKNFSVFFFLSSCFVVLIITESSLFVNTFFKNFLFKINFLIVYIYSNYSVFLLLFLIYLLDFFQFLVEKYQKNHRSKNLLL